jgi:hypothetical protein
MVDKTDMDERLEHLDREWRRKYEEREEQWRRKYDERENQWRRFAERTHGEIAKVVGEGVATVVRDLKTADKVVRAIKAGFARLRAIDAAAEAERDSDAPLN